LKPCVKTKDCHLTDSRWWILRYRSGPFLFTQFILLIAAFVNINFQAIIVHFRDHIDYMNTWATCSPGARFTKNPK